MYVYVSWAYTQKAEEADAIRTDWVNKATKPEGMTDEEKQFVADLAIESCLPEYSEFLATLSHSSYDFFSMPMDKANKDLLSVRIMAPAIGKISNFQLAKRMPAADKLPLSLAVRAFLLNTFVGEWTGKQEGPKLNRVTFVGFKGLNQFLSDLAVACGVLDNPLPIDCWLSSPRIELCDDASVRRMMESCAFNHKNNTEESEKYRKIVAGWLGTGASADRDMALLLSTAYKLGLKDS